MELSSIQLQCHATLTSVPVGQEVPLHVVVKVQAPRLLPRGKERLSVVLALDVSGSMQGPPLEHLVQATERLLDRLQDGDSVGVVAFSSQVVVMAPLQPLSASTRSRLRHSLRGLYAEGSTDLGEALHRAGELFGPPQKEERQLLLLVTDGQPTAGLGSPLAHLAARHQAAGGPQTGSLAASSPGDDSIEQAWERLLQRAGLAAESGNHEGKNSAPPDPAEEQLAEGPLSRRSADLRAKELAPGTLASLVWQAERLRRRGVTLSTLGCGPECESVLLATLAAAGGGHHATVQDPEQTESALIEVIGAPLALVLEKPRLLLRPCEDVSLGRILGDQRGRVTTEGLELALPDLFSGGSHHVVIETTLRAWREGSWTLLLVDLEGTTAKRETITARVSTAIEVTAGRPPQHHQATEKLAAIAMAEDRRGRARELAARRDIEEAILLLRRAVAGLESTAGFTSGDGSLLDEAHRALLHDLHLHAPRPGDHRVLALGQLPRPASLLFSRDLPLRLASLDALDRRRVTPAQRLANLCFTAGPRRGDVVPLARMRMTLGNDPLCEVNLGSSGTARYHAIIEQFGGESWLFDLESLGGVWVNGRNVRCHHLSHGDKIRLGEHEAIFSHSRHLTSAPPPSPAALSSV